MDAYAQRLSEWGKVDREMVGKIKEALRGMSPGREVRLDHGDGRPMEVVVGPPSLQRAEKSEAQKP